ncbi:hypothetical protein PFLA_a1205 [Pseudoalteromonas flavipulchra NCIMB 2033 = ATCC BAA-314]|nr:hypothetical protein [Pseudoalteromonas flavipulchra NCIMB 2033 = ATCC BAA-314]
MQKAFIKASQIAGFFIAQLTLQRLQHPLCLDISYTQC